MTDNERISRDWAQEQRGERRYQRELHADAYGYVEADSVEVPEPTRKTAGNFTTQMNLFDEEVA